MNTMKNGLFIRSTRGHRSQIVVSFSLSSLPLSLYVFSQHNKCPKELSIVRTEKLPFVTFKEMSAENLVVGRAQQTDSCHECIWNNKRDRAKKKNTLISIWTRQRTEDRVHTHTLSSRAHLHIMTFSEMHKIYDTRVFHVQTHAHIIAPLHDNN